MCPAKRCHYIFYSARSYSLAVYWIHFIARSKGVHAFGYKSAGSEPIWMKLGTSSILSGAVPRDFGRDARISESGSASRFYSALQCSHRKRCTSYSNSIRLSLCVSVRLSVTYARIVSKRRHVARCSLHCWIAKCV